MEKRPLTPTVGDRALVFIAAGLVVACVLAWIF